MIFIAAIFMLFTTAIGGAVGHMAFTPPHELAGMLVGFLAGGLCCVGAADDAADFIGDCF